MDINEVKEMNKIFNAMKNHKACDLGRIQSDLAKHSIKKNLEENLSKIFIKCLKEGNIPSEWKHAHITPIHKKYRNYRGVSVTSFIVVVTGIL